MTDIPITLDVETSDVEDVLAAFEGPGEWPAHEFDDINLHFLNAYFHPDRDEAGREALWHNMPVSLQWAVHELEKRGPWRLRAFLLEAELAARSAPALPQPFPEILVLCGSTRFYDEFQQANYEATMNGKIVLPVGFYPHAKARHGHGEGVGHDSTEKLALDELHMRKIDLADRVLVLNVGGYIGTSTRAEIDYAESIGKPIEYLEAM